MRYLSVGFLIIILSLNLVVFDVNFHKNKSECDENCGNVVKYFLFLDDLEGDYSEDELIHMQDVRNLVIGSLVLMLILIGFTIFAEKRDFLIGGIIGFGLLGLFALFSLINFSWGFTMFHKIFFTNDLWLLPMDSLLISMYSIDFFYSCVLRIILYISLFSGLSIIWGIIKWKRKK
jgi:integral membrane protein (TIGR01906 family)